MEVPAGFTRGFLDWFRERIGASVQGRLSEAELADVQARWGVCFPPDFRLLLRRVGNGAPLYDWRTDARRIRTMFAWLWEGLQFDVEHDALWLSSWGPKPATLGAQKEYVRELVEAAPKLIPVFGHRYLLAEPCVAGNPVFSVYQSDIIVYGADLRDYLLNEFADLLGLDRRAVERETRAAIQRRYTEFTDIPFWGELLDL